MMNVPEWRAAAAGKRCGALAATLPILLMTALWLCACAGPSSVDQGEQQLSALPCSLAAPAFWETGSQLRRSYGDGQGHHVELWCDRNLFSSHWDLRIDGGEPPEVRRSMTIGGCFFNEGESNGPIIYEGERHQYARIEWTNQDPANEHEKYKFVYDYSTGLVTITATEPGAPPAMAMVHPQESWEKLKDLLPDPRHPDAASN
jgi:hypothetical protein